MVPVPASSTTLLISPHGRRLSSHRSTNDYTPRVLKIVEFTCGLVNNRSSENQGSGAYFARLGRLGGPTAASFA
ncbi:hypothetical protein ACOSQ3_020545 [Xanthoceras sorbifolium]